jgi:hypothetical protein
MVVCWYVVFGYVECGMWCVVCWYEGMWNVLCWYVHM